MKDALNSTKNKIDLPKPITNLKPIQSVVT